MATTRGDINATLKDLTIIAEDTVAMTRPNLYPLICSVQPEEGAYTRVAIPANIPFPRKFEGERDAKGKDINVIQTYNQDTYELSIELDSDLVKNAKAYGFSDLIREVTMSGVLFPDYLASQAVINGNSATLGLAYDGNAFYGDTHNFAKMGATNIDNNIAATGQTVTQLATDLGTAITQVRIFKDNQGRLLNQNFAQGSDKLMIHCPVALQQAFNQVIFGSMIPVSAPVTTSGTAAAPVANNVLQGIASVFADGYLDSVSSTAWFLHYVGMPQRPFIFLENYPIQVSVLGFGSEHEIKTNKVMICLKHRFVLGYYRFDRSIRVS